MAKRHKPEEIITKLRQVDVLVSQGSSVADAIRTIGVTEVTDYRWRQEYGVILPRFGGHEVQLAFRSACSGVM